MFRSSLMAFAILAAASLGLVSYVTRHGMMPLPSPAAPPVPHVQATLPVTTAAPVQTLANETVLKADPFGHFATDVDIDGHRIRMMVDTGATVVVLTNEDAAALGLHPSNGDFRVAVATANGAVQTAPTHLWRIGIGSIFIYDVDALISPPGVLRQSLLGMTALRKLRNFKISADQLVLEQ